MSVFGTLFSTVRRIIPSANDRLIKRLRPIVDAINQRESALRSASDQELRDKTAFFRQQIDNGMPLDDLLIDAFSVVREASRRTLEMRHFDVQLIGGIVLHQGKIAEMKTGEGKTLVATLPIYLNALTGKGVHLVTVNDYLARRDADWMGRIYRFLNMSVGVIQTTSNPEQHFHAYRCDITYGTNNEFGFDYLRDNMKHDARTFVQREHHFAIVDEVDSILIDEARTPLIISGQSEETTDLYARLDKVVPRLMRDVDFTIDEKSHSVALNESGIAKAEKSLGIDNLYDPKNMLFQHHLNQALRAHVLFKRDVDYVVKDNQIIIVDEFTGRLMPGRRWSDGLHQAIEAKEGVKIANENQTLASITFQNYFRMYKKLAGMTGTAQTEAAEFAHIYKLDVASIPTNRSLIRVEYPDVIYKTEREKFNAVVREIEENHKSGRPVLVGTIAIEKSEKLSQMLKRKGISHNVLNAKHHEREAEIVSQAGRLNMVTIATNMAGRGTDILLGGNPEFLAREETVRSGVPEQSDEYERVYLENLEKMKELTRREHDNVVALGGLHIIGTERHESRRIDNQLRGRAGRQGDPGSSRFYLSLEDDLMRIFGSDRIASLMERLGMQDDEPIEHPWVTKSIETAQKRVEQHNFSIRKNLLEYDDVMNRQRELIYSQRNVVLRSEDLTEYVQEMVADVLEEILENHIPSKSHPEQWDMEGLEKSLIMTFGGLVNLSHPAGDYWTDITFLEYLSDEYLKVYRAKEQAVGVELHRRLEKYILLERIDVYWKDHLLNMDHLKEGIGLRGYGQRDPLTEYKREGFDLFEALISAIKRESVRVLFHFQPVADSEIPLAKRPSRVVEGRGAMQSAHSPEREEPDDNRRTPQPVTTVRRISNKVGRNDPCPCGSGKKYKKCCGASQPENPDTLQSDQ